MYNNVGRKLMVFARNIMIFGIAASILIGFVLCLCGLYDTDHYGFLILIGLGIAVILTFIMWLLGLFMYAFGQLVDDVHALRNKECAIEQKKPVVVAKKQEESQVKTTTTNPNKNVSTTQQAEHSTTKTSSNLAIKCVCGMRFYGQECPNCGRKAKDL